MKHSLISADPGQGSVVGFCEYGDELPYSVEMAFNVHNLLLRLVFFFSFVPRILWVQVSVEETLWEQSSRE